MKKVCTVCPFSQDCPLAQVPKNARLRLCQVAPFIEKDAVSAPQKKEIVFVDTHKGPVSPELWNEAIQLIGTSSN